MVGDDVDTEQNRLPHGRGDLQLRQQLIAPLSILGVNSAS